MSGGYDPAHFDKLFAVEDRHFWFRARNRIISVLAAQGVRGLPARYRVLEVGCGDGNVLRFLQDACPGGLVIGMDYFAEGLRLAAQRSSCQLVQGDLANPPFGTSFQMVGIFDVLEHLPDDRAVLGHLWRFLTPGGLLLLTVPAHQSLWSAFDEAAGHCRRYETADLTQKLDLAGFDVEYVTPFMASIYPLVWLSRRWRRTASLEDATSRELRVIPVLNRILSFLLFREAAWIKRRRPLPIGTSLLAVARKRARVLREAALIQASAT